MFTMIKNDISGKKLSSFDFLYLSSALTFYAKNFNIAERVPMMQLYENIYDSKLDYVLTKDDSDLIHFIRTHVHFERTEIR